ncbi:CDP-glycerol glycerophosphotransferase family protein [uncultured Ferrimonas sp.]|uniref:CDP-glycerol glycerophosphotransferase family protein n=1 Tax=uncultured Ferrimonas sp. TaxID=432640 RepID=UPI002622F77B|nr:CDP-glycerol glycerophosphotransferase family protein [uncultured Ferrimonas sp.]
MYVHQNYSFAILRPIQRYIIENGGKVAWFLEGNEVDHDLLERHEHQLCSIKDIQQWKPNATFVPGNVVPSFIPGVKVAVFHGFNSGKLNRRGRLDHFEIRGCFDLYCTQGPNTTSEFVKLSKQYGFFDVVETGWPTLDPMFTEEGINPYRSEDKRPVLLFCSTFSHKYSCAPKLKSRIKELRDSKKYRILVQFHPKMDEETVLSYKKLEDESLMFVETNNLIPLIKIADVMLCDTSSAVQMFLLAKKPVVTFRTQFPMPYLLDIQDESDLNDAISEVLSKPTVLMNEIESYRQQLHPYCDGKSAERVVNATNKIIETGTSHLGKKPLNIIRNLKMRRKLNYWKV